MPKPTGPTDPNLMHLIMNLRKTKKRIWRAIAEQLQKPRRTKVAVNLSKINRHTKEGNVIIVPGKVLGSGLLNHKVSIAALVFTKQAKEKIKAAGGESITIEELVSRNPNGSNVLIVK